MVNGFETLAARSELSAEAASELHHQGFIILPGPVPSERLESLTNAYTAAMSSASGPDVRVGSTSTRVSEFVNRGIDFDPLYVFPPLLDACCRVIGQPFKLSSLQGAFIPRAGQAATDFGARMQPDTRARLSAFARHVLAA